MIIKSVSIEDFLSHRRSEVSFDEGINVIVGPNGAGKSSIIDAIAFALTGEALTRKYGRGTDTTKTELIRKGARRAKVTLRIEIDGVEYIVERTLDAISSKTARTDAVLIRMDNGKGRIEAKGARAVTEAILQKMGLKNPTYLSKLLFVPQGNLMTVIEDTPSNRRQMIIQLLQLDKLSTAQENIGKALSNFKQELHELDKEKALLEHRKKEIELFEKKLEQMYTQRKSYERELNKLLERLKEIEPKVQELEKRRNEYIEYKTRLESLNKIIERTKDQINKKKKEVEQLLGNYTMEKLLEKRKRLEEILEKKDDILRRYTMAKDLEKKLDELKKIEDELKENLGIDEKIRNIERDLRKLRELERELTEKRIKSRDIENELSRVQRDLTTLRRLTGGISVIDLNFELEELNKELEKMEKRRDQLLRLKAMDEQRIEELKKALSLLKDKPYCPVCGRKLEPREREELRMRYETELQRIERKISKEMREINVLNNKIKKLKERIDNLTKIINRALGILDKYNEKYNAQEFDIDDLEILESELQKKMKEIGKSMEIEKLLKKVRTDIEKAERELEKLRSVQQRINSLKGIKETLEKQIEELEKIVGSDIEEVEREYLEIIRAEKEWKEVSEKIDRLNILFSSLNDLYERINEYEKDKAEILERLKEIRFNEKEYEQYVTEYERLKEEVSSLRTKLEALREKIEEYKEYVKEKDKIIKKINELDKKIMLMREYIEFIDNDVRPKLRNDVVALVLSSFRDQWSEATNEILKLFDTSVMSVSIDEGWNIKVITSAGESPVGFLSGGERVALALAMRIGMARVLIERNLTFMILDEPTIYLDMERKRNLKDVILAATRGGLHQLIIVTHDKEITDVADKLIIVEKSGSTSVVSEQ
ncbi:hypothetical protein IPA_04190 [Ignicoccus pacificus DSM 13166]|uniref:DNA double-strand break repair Rad50 ATPase n=1 Tax=Ignicoccus pacificus DSM 13166 TaxID=940294 RepID=A0A977KB69_9CREN|nr:hypothetical protein IPA_04190 [Ignicoccus pacificus DSM 13166]